MKVGSHGLVCFIPFRSIKSWTSLFGEINLSFSTHHILHTQEGVYKNVYRKLPWCTLEVHIYYLRHKERKIKSGLYFFPWADSNIHPARHYQLICSCSVFLLLEAMNFGWLRFRKVLRWSCANDFKYHYSTSVSSSYSFWLIKWETILNIKWGKASM